MQRITVKEEYEMFSAVWKYYRMFREVQDLDEFYQRAVAEAHNIHDKYPTKLCEDLLLAVTKEIDARGRRLHVRIMKNRGNCSGQSEV